MERNNHSPCLDEKNVVHAQASASCHHLLELSRWTRVGASRMTCALATHRILISVQGREFDALGVFVNARVV